MAYKLQEATFASNIEEFYLACLELKLIEWAQVFLKAICTMYPNNVKSVRFLAMWYEAQGNNFRAQEIYQELLESCP
jgi:cytochrome c-type biogenesis protein CcmH/NrfG